MKTITFGDVFIATPKNARKKYKIETFDNVYLGWVTFETVYISTICTHDEFLAIANILSVLREEIRKN